MLICFWTAYNSWFYWTVISFSHSKDGCSQELLNLDKLSNLKHMALYSAVAYEAIKRVVCWSMTAAHCVVVYVDVLEGNQNKNNCLMSKFFCCRNCSKGSCSYFDLPLGALCLTLDSVTRYSQIIECRALVNYFLSGIWNLTARLRLDTTKLLNFITRWHSIAQIFYCQPCNKEPFRFFNMFKYKTSLIWKEIFCAKDMTMKAIFCTHFSILI